MDSGYLILFGLGIGLLASLIGMLVPIGFRGQKKRSSEMRGYCPVCAQGLRKGESLRSSVTEIGDVEVQTRIRGCPFCLGVMGNRKRYCPVCKKKLKKDAEILAISDPRVDRNKLAIRGCKKCYPQGF